MKKVIEYFGTGLVFLFLAAVVIVILAPHFGWRVDSVLSGSMEPQIKVGGIVVTQPIDSKDIKIGDAITFYCPLNKQMVTHRVIAVEIGESSYFRTKGDANENADPFVVPFTNLVGKVCLHIPYMGYVMQLIKTPLGLLLSLLIPGLIIIILESMNIWRVLCGKERAKHPAKVRG
jgi:signal peptidase